jgi:hypothetical protein
MPILASCSMPRLPGETRCPPSSEVPTPGRLFFPTPTPQPGPEKEKFQPASYDRGNHPLGETPPPYQQIAVTRIVPDYWLGDRFGVFGQHSKDPAVPGSEKPARQVPQSPKMFFRAIGLFFLAIDQSRFGVSILALHAFRTVPGFLNVWVLTGDS